MKVISVGLNALIRSANMLCFQFQVHCQCLKPNVHKFPIIFQLSDSFLERNQRPWYHRLCFCVATVPLQGRMAVQFSPASPACFVHPRSWPTMLASVCLTQHRICC